MLAGMFFVQSLTGLAHTAPRLGTRDCAIPHTPELQSYMYMYVHPNRSSAFTCCMHQVPTLGSRAARSSSSNHPSWMWLLWYPVVVRWLQLLSGHYRNLSIMRDTIYRFMTCKEFRAKSALPNCLLEPLTCFSIAHARRNELLTATELLHIHWTLGELYQLQLFKQPLHQLTSFSR